MESLLALLKGPVLVFVVVILVLGLIRHIVLSVWGMIEARRRAGDRDIPYLRVLLNIATWSVPVTRLHRVLPIFSYASFLFHVGLLSSALFLKEHIDQLRPLGISWPAIPHPYVDWLALLALVSLAVLLGYRIYVRQSRAESGFADYGLLVLLIIAVGMGYVAGQSWNVLPYNMTMVLHISAGATILVLIPFTKLSHCVLYPLVRLSSEIGWHFAREGGYDVVRTLYGPEGRRV